MPAYLKKSLLPLRTTISNNGARTSSPTGYSVLADAQGIRCDKIRIRYPSKSVQGLKISFRLPTLLNFVAVVGGMLPDSLCSCMYACMYVCMYVCMYEQSTIQG